MLLSIIIPVYNLEDYIEQCLDSIKVQINEFDNIEVIVINDGSSDTTQLKLKNYNFRNNWLKVFEQSNQGVSSARNQGVLISKGEFVVFLDGDDKLEDLALRNLVSVLASSLEDLLILGYKSVDEFGNCYYRTNFKNYTNISHINLSAYYDTIGENNPLADTNRSVGLVYRSELLKKMQGPYPMNVPYLEDAAFLSKFFLIMKSYQFFEFNFFVRIMRNGSAVNSNLFNSKKAINGFTQALNDINSFRTRLQFEGFEFKIDRIVHLNQTIIKFTTLRVISAINAKSIELLKYVILIGKNEKVTYSIKHVRYPFNIWGWSYRVSVYLFILLFFVHSRLKFIFAKLK
jgi:glycosyltransferase involved in cell wall biosynthesis